MDQTITQWPQGIGIGESTKLSAEKKPRPEKELALNCPRCNSINTKFCYYNNYNLSQPRYFCKTCRRYWTQGGSLRNVPVGGGSRKNKRISSSNNNSSISSKKLIQSPQNPKIHEGQDLNLAYNPSNYNGIFGLNLNPNKNPNLDPSSSSSQIPVMEILKAGNMSSMGLGLSSFMGSESNSVYNGVSSGFALHDGFKQSLSFSLDGINENGYGNLVQDHMNNSRMPFPFEELKQSVSANDQFDHQDRGNAGSESNGYWTGMLNGGSW